MVVPKYIQVVFVLVVLIVIVMFGKNYLKKDELHSVNTVTESHEVIPVSADTITSERTVSIENKATLPIKNIISAEQVKHSIPLDEIRQGCARQDCIPSVDAPEFISTKNANEIIVPDQIGIALSYKGENRFYPFSMLVTKEIVNDVVAGDPILITYCPLCGTGIVFDRTVDGVVYEFGVSGMLWQSNLLMYNRAENIENRNLWSQVLGEAVVGKRTGTALTVVTSDIMQYETWAGQNPDALVLDTGSQRDPYNGNYFDVAQRFAPDFDQRTSPLAADAYVYGIEVGGVFKAYPRDVLSDGEFHDMINGEEITVTINNGKVAFLSAEGAVIQDVEGFWFSWVAVHPETLIWKK